MKRILISMAALLAVVGCAKQEDLVSANFASGPEFGVGIDATRVAIAEDGEAYKLSWTKGDLISVFYTDNGNSQYKFMGETGDVSGKIVAVEAQDGNMLPNYYAIYPYNESNELNGDVLSFTLPAEQSYEANTFGLGANTMVARTIGEGKYDFAFTNVCGYIRLKVYGNATIKSIELKGNNNEIISGAATYDMASDELGILGDGETITVNCGEGVTLGATEAEATSFWIVVPPTTFEQGFTITLTDSEDKTMEKVLDSNFTVERNTVHGGTIKFSTKPVVVDENLLFDAQFNDNGTATDGGKFDMTIQRMVDENGATPNMTTAYDSKLQRNVVTFNHVPTNPENDVQATTNHSYYFVDFSENAEFEAAITDGYTFEILTYRVEPIEGNTVWSFPFSFGSETVRNGGWGVFHNSRGATWAPAWRIFSQLKEGGLSLLRVEPSMEQYEHLIISCEADGTNNVYENGVLRYTGNHALNLQDGHKNFAIGGAPLTDGICRGYYGKVAMIRIYDKPMTALEARERCNSLNIPARYDVLLDVKFNDNGSVSDAGIYQLPMKAVGSPTIENGIATLSNPEGATNQFFVADAGSQWSAIWNEITSGGFTYETVIARTSADSEGAPFSTGVLNAGENRAYRLQALAGNDHRYKSWSWQDVGMSDEAGLHTAVADLDMFYHVVARYDGFSAGHFSIYVNGELIAYLNRNEPWGLAMNQEFSSQLLGIGAVPQGAYDAVTGALGFDGKVAVARLYSANLPAYAIRARYEELKPTIEALNQETLNDRFSALSQYVLMDAKFNADGTVTDQSKYQLPMKTVGEVTIENGVATLSNPAGATNNYIVANANSNWDTFYGDMVNNGGFTYEAVVSRTTADAEGSIFALGVNNSSQLQTFRVQAIKGAEHYYKIWSWVDVAMNNESNMHSATPNLDEYYHVVAKAEGGPVAFFWSIYVNGEFVSIMQQAHGWDICLNDISLLLGIGGRPVGAYDDNTGDFGFDGKIATARLYGKALSADDIKACYNNVKAQINALNAQ